MNYEYNHNQEEVNYRPVTTEQIYYLLQIINDIVNIGAFTQINKYDLCQACGDYGIRPEFQYNVCKFQCYKCGIEYKLEDHIPSLYDDVEMLCARINKDIEQTSIIMSEGDLLDEINLLFDEFITIDKQAFCNYYYTQIITHFI